jgi:phosphatidylethanolamine-binding protein (PEBP) family uncharacterized protein
MGRRFVGGRDGSGAGGMPRLASLVGVAACLCAAVAIAGCGESSSGGSASVASTTTAASAATGPTAATGTTAPKAPTTPATTSTAAKPPTSKSSGSSTAAKKATTTPATAPAKTSTKPGKPSKQELGFGKIKITSAAFKAGGPIAVKYTCDGAGTSPPLRWTGVPRSTAEVFMLAIDLSGSANDAIQWAVAGLSPTTTEIPEGGLPAGAVAGVNSAGKVGWAGICGAKGQLHHVGFLFYALKHRLDLRSGFNPAEVRGGLKGQTLATGLTLATYQRP